ncbi:glycoside hydrolase [Pyrenochaeta sp. MPI-SDFR-AT-0127]|nr:glycoside hydrolase [Pyrenochaeta sp. MPI-SDFR-AT-0127]
MFARTSVLSLAFSYFVNQAIALEIDASSQDSIKSTAKTLAGGIIAAYQDSLQEDLTPGLFSKDYFWWESGAVFHGLVEYSHLTGDSQYDALVSEALQWQIGEYDAYMPVNQTKSLGNEDQSTWGLAAMTAAEVGFSKPKKGEWVDYAANVFDTQVVRLQLEEKNNTCKGGGLRWQIFTFNDGYEYKDAGSNGNFFLLAARLAKFTGNQTYTQWAEKSYTWAKDNGIVSDFSVYAGARATKECEISKLQWSGYHAVYTEGAALLYNLTNGAQNWTDTVKGFVNTSSVFQSSGDSPVLVETACESNGNCDTDQRAFKGIAARSYARAAMSAPIIAESISKVLQASAKGAARACDGNGADVSCRLDWTDGESKWESASAKKGNLGEVFGALEVVQALLYPQAKPLLASGGASGGKDGSGSGNTTQSAGPSGVSGASVPQSTGSAGTIAASVTAVMVVAFAAALSC